MGSQNSLFMKIIAADANWVAPPVNLTEEILITVHKHEIQAWSFMAL